MNKPLYSNKYSVVFPTTVDISLGENFKAFYGNIDQVTLDIKKYELEQDELFAGHIIINDINYLNNTLDFLLSEKKIDAFLEKLVSNFSLGLNNIYVNKIYHHGVDSKCYVEDKIVFCSTWSLPFYSYIKRANNTLYANFVRHRIQMIEFLKSIKGSSTFPSKLI